jgi:ribose-phosphate pyrophosphokinase
VQGCFSNSPLDNLAFQHDFAQYLRTQPWFERDSTVVVSPDAGGVARAHQLAELLDIRGIVTIMKRRAAAGVVDSMQTVGEVAGRTCIIVDDMCDTGGTLIKACELLKSMGAVRVVACATHGILTEPCVDRLNAGTALDELIVSDSIPQDGNVKRCPKLRVLSIAPLLASAITMYHTEMSVGALFRAPSSLAHVVGSRRLTVSASGVNSGNPTSSRPHSTHNSPQTMNQTMSSSAFGPMLDTPTIIAANRRPFPPSPAE